MRIGICCYPTAGGSGVVATELGKHLAVCLSGRNAASVARQLCGEAVQGGVASGIVADRLVQVLHNF